MIHYSATAQSGARENYRFRKVSLSEEQTIQRLPSISCWYRQDELLIVWSSYWCCLLYFSSIVWHHYLLKLTESVAWPHLIPMGSCELIKTTSLSTEFQQTWMNHDVQHLQTYSIYITVDENFSEVNLCNKLKHDRKVSIRIGSASIGHFWNC